MPFSEALLKSPQPPQSHLLFCNNLHLFVSLPNRLGELLFLLLALRAFPFVEVPLDTADPGELRDGDCFAGGGEEENTVLQGASFVRFVSQHPSKSGGQFIGRPHTFVELQLRFKLHFFNKKMQFEMQLELHKRLWTTNELTAWNVIKQRILSSLSTF